MTTYPIEEDSTYFSSLFWKKTLERALKTIAQVVLITWPTAEVFDLSDVTTFRTVGISAAAGFVYSIIMSVASAVLGPKETPSLV